MIIFDKLLSGEEEVLERIFNRESRDFSLLITYFNQHCFNIYFKNDNYKKLIDENFSCLS